MASSRDDGSPPLHAATQLEVDALATVVATGYVTCSAESCRVAFAFGKRAMADGRFFGNISFPGRTSVSGALVNKLCERAGAAQRRAGGGATPVVRVTGLTLAPPRRARLQARARSSA